MNDLKFRIDVGPAFLVSGVLALLKVLGVITIPWWSVAAPSILSVVFILALFALMIFSRGK